MSRSSRSKKALSDEDKINEQLERLRAGYNDQRIFSLVYTESVNAVDEPHTPPRNR